MNCVDREGRAIDLNTWGTLWKTPGYREIGKEEYSNGELLSTVYIGVPPAIFETLFFRKTTISTNYQRCYDTEAEAVKGHTRLNRLRVLTDRILDSLMA